MDPARRQDFFTVTLVALLVVPILAATLATSGQNRDEHRAIDATHAALISSAVSRANVSDPLREQLLRQQVALETLEQRAALQHARVDDYKDFTLYGLAILGALVAVVGILFPVGLYLTSIRPGEKVVDEARQLIGSGLDQRFEQLVEKQRGEQVAAAMSKLRSDEPTIRQIGALYFSLNQHVPLTELQLFDLTAILRKADPALQAQLAPALAFRESPYVEAVLGDILEASTNLATVLIYVLQHCGVPSAGTLRNRVKAWAKTKLGAPSLPTLFAWGASQSPRFVEELLNDEQWISDIPPRTKMQCLTQLRAMGGTVKTENTALARSVAGTICLPVDAQLKDTDLATAKIILVHVDGVQKQIHHRGSPAFDEAAKQISASGKSQEQGATPDPSSP